MKFAFFASLSLLAGTTTFADVPAQTPAIIGKPTTAPAANPSPALGVGAHFDELRVGKNVYRDVQVREVTVRSILFSDTDGIASIPLHTLPPNLQRAFGYQPALEEIADQRLALSQRAMIRGVPPKKAVISTETEEKASAKFVKLMESFREPPVIEPLVDLRPKFQELTLGVKDQGRRPSCAIFAVVSAYEFENAQLIGRPEKLSEDYLIWATCQTLKRAPQLISPDQIAEDPADDDRDLGFSYAAVLASLGVFGIAPAADMPDTYSKIGDIAAPSPALIRDSSMRRKLSIHYLPGEDNAARLGNVIHALNESIPVPIGLRWPLPRTLRTGRLNEQRPTEESRHAVTLVGYTCSSGKLEDTEFIFKNSYGPHWGEAGYGRATFKYLSEYLLTAVVLEVRRPDEAERIPVSEK